MFEVRPAASIIHPDTIGLADRAIPQSLSPRRSVKFKSVFETISLSWIPFFKVVNPLWGIIIIPRDIKRVHGPLAIIHLIHSHFQWRNDLWSSGRVSDWRNGESDWYPWVTRATFICIGRKKQRFEIGFPVGLPWHVIWQLTIKTRTWGEMKADFYCTTRFSRSKWA